MQHLASALPPPCLWLCAVVVVFLLGCEATTPRPECSVQSTNGVVRSGDVCSFTYYPSKSCDFMTSDHRLRYTNASQELESLVVQDAKGNFLSQGHCQPLDRANALVDLRFTLRHSRRVMLVVSGVTSRGEKRCVTVEYQERPGWEVTALTAQTLPLPHGAYTATLLIFGREHPVTSHVDVMVIGHQSFYVHTVCYRWDKVQRRSKRVGDTSHLLPVGSLVMETSRTKDPCSGCYSYNHTYFNDTGSLQFFYYLNAVNEESCFSNCSDVDIWLYKHRYVHKEKDCIPGMNISIRNLIFQRLHKNVSKGLVEYRNLESGCYVLQLEAVIYRFPQYSYYVWVEPSNYINMDKWNTTFNLEPNHLNRSLWVRWLPNQEYNFSEYELLLWHNRNYSISCRGNNTTRGPIKIIQSSGSLSVSGTEFIFHNLSIGWYCARLTPKDDRCNVRGCPTLNSRAERLLDLTEIKDPPPLNIIPIVIGVAVVVLLAGVVLACCVLRHYPTCGGYKPTFVEVSGIQGLELKDTPVILLVWTPYGPHGADFIPIITAFKDVLQSYCHCKVYDYMDLMSLPEEQRHHLLNSPIAWINNLLTRSNVKIIIVATEGAKLRQEEGMSPVISQNYINTPQAITPHDSMLFPYLLRCLQDRIDLAGDYSRIFHVRFSDVSDSSAELEGIVSWTRFRLPEHLKSLTLSIHGIPESCNIDEPSIETLRKLSAAIVAHPLYGQCELAKLHPENGGEDSSQP